MSKKHTIDFIKRQIESDIEYELLSTEYINNQSKLWVKHIECGHEYKVSYGNFQKGKRCPKCAQIKRKTSQPTSLSISIIRQIAEQFNYKVLSEEYVNALSKYKFQCDKGHKYESEWASFQQGYRCPKCSGNYPLTYDQIKFKVEESGYTLLTKKVVKSNQKIHIRCNKGHKCKVIWNNFQRGRRCSRCNAESRSSKPEIEVQHYVKTLVGDVIENDRTQILNPLTGRYLELDIWLPKLKRAIEFNGKYWHSLKESIRRDTIKRCQCKKLGIELLIINEQDFINNKESEMEKIKEFVLWEN